MENVISDADYKFLKAKLKADGYDQWYFIVWFMAATGARVSELLQIKAEHVSVGLSTSTAKVARCAASTSPNVYRNPLHTPYIIPYIYQRT